MSLLVCVVAAVALLPACIAAHAAPVATPPEPSHRAAGAEALSRWHALKQDAKAAQGTAQHAHAARTLQEVSQRLFYLTSKKYS